MSDAHDNSTAECDVSDLPRPAILTPRQMLEEREDINVLAPLVRCSKLPFRHLTSMYETHITHTPMILAEEFSRSQIARTADFSTSVYERGVFWMRERNTKRRKLESEEEDQGQRDQAYYSSLRARPLPCARQIDPSYGRLPSLLQPPGKDYVLTRGILLAQFASPTGKALADAVELISTPVAGAEGDQSVRLVDGVDLNCPWAYASGQSAQLQVALLLRSLTQPKCTGIGSGLLRKPELVADMVRAVKDRMGWDYNISVKIRVDSDLQYVPLSSTAFTPD
ncbi:hypothetical protein QFC21_002464 [Naganishia friedmannii]|uniref:Uncharacterized protein n=1 Tax=Naganishia friedmannii TaxID=89922 RepID=A0ACC2VY05_9TREE|nr:hypothetical protein QFC21_002464 [Naganishia friedmannii]